MIAASFLVEYLGISWVEGARWFHDTLVDADVAINAMMWQVFRSAKNWHLARGHVFSTKFCYCFRTPGAAALTSGISCCLLKQGLRMRLATSAANGCPSWRISPTSTSSPNQCISLTSFASSTSSADFCTLLGARLPKCSHKRGCSLASLTLIASLKTLQQLVESRSGRVLCCPLFLDIIAKYMVTLS